MNKRSARQVAAAKEAERVRHREDLLDEALREGFPASDPPSLVRPHPRHQ